MAEVIRLSISEAAKLFGVNPQTIRRAIKDQEIGYVVVRGRYHLTFDTVLKWSQKKSTVKNKFESRGIGQYVDKWKIKNPLYSPNPKLVKEKITQKTTEKNSENSEPLVPKNQPSLLPEDNIKINAKKTDI